MIGKKINQLATELAPVSTDLTIIGDPTTGVSKKITLAQLGAIFSGAVAFYTNLAGFPATGSLDIIYCAKDTQKLYLWSGSAYVEMFPSQALLDTYQLRSEKGNANGYASLDSLGKVPISQLPSSLMEYKGMWNAATNTPTLANGTGDTGDVYICNVAGTVNFGAGPITFAVGDYVIYSGTIWQRSSGAVGTVTSVALTVGGDAISVSGSPLTTSGTLALAFSGTTSQYIRGNGTLATFPSLTGFVPYTGATANVDLGTHTLLAKNLVINHSSGSGVAASITKGGSGEALTVVKSSGSGNAASITGGVTLLDELHLNTDLADAYIASATNWNAAYNDKINSAAVTGTTTKTLTLTQQDGGTITASWTDINTDAVTSVFGRTGAVVAASGDYTTAQVTESGNLYFTNARAIASTLTGYTSGAGTITSSDSILSAIQKLNGNIGALTTGVSSVNGLTGAVTLTTSNIAEGTNLYYTEARVNANTNVAANTAARHNAVTIGTANGLSLSTQVLSLALASGSTTGALSSTDWTTFNNKQNALTNPVTGTGTTNTLPKFTGASTIGNSNITDTGSLITLGSNSYVNGNLGVGTTSLSTYSLAVAKNMTGGTLVYGVGSYGTIQSDVTSGANGFITALITAAASFTLTNYRHFYANQGTIGAGSVVTNQTAFFVDSNVIGATNNYAFRSIIPAGTNRWNLYMDGTADNYLAGSLGIGNTSLDTTMLRISRAFTSTLATSIFLDSQVSSTNTSATYIATNANTQAATFTTQIRHISLVQGTFGAGSTVTNQYGIIVGDLTGATNNYGFFGNISAATNRWNLFMAGTAANYMAGDTSIGTTTGGYKLNVNGTFNVTGAATFSSSVTANSLIKSGGTSSQYLMADGSTSTLTNPVTGTGTTNYLPKFTGTSTIGNSLVFDNGVAVGIGTTTPSPLIAGSRTLEISQAGDNFPALNISRTSGISYTNVNWRLFLSSDASLHFRQNSTDRLILSASGNLGLGVTPSAWGSGQRALQTPAGAIWNFNASNMSIVQNVFSDGTEKYVNNGFASTYNQNSGQHVWRTAPSGTAGNAISFTQAMTLDASGNLMVGDTSTYNVRMNVVGAGATTSTGSGSSNIVMLLRDTSAGGINVGAGLGFAGNDGVNTGVTFATINGRKENSTSGNYASYLSFRTRANGDTLTEQLRIASTGAATFSSSVTATRLNGINNAGGVSAEFGSTTAVNTYIIYRYNNSAIAYIGNGPSIFAGAGATDLGITTAVASALLFGTNNTEGMRITSAGLLGIGTTAPNSLLEVNKTITFSNIDTYAQLVVKTTSGANGKLLNIGVDEANSISFIQSLNRGTDAMPLSLQRYGGNVGIGTASPSEKLDVNGNIKASNLYSGTYTPTLSSVYNIASSTAFVCQYMRVGNVVTVSGVINVTATATNTWTRISMTLPISSNFDFSYRAGGGGGANSTNNVCVILAGASTSVVYLDAYPNSTNSLSYYFSYTYQII
jgi:hypothetical protein